MTITEPSPLTVSEFLARINEILVEQVAWVEGEITDLRVSQGRWLHFDLKDQESLVHCFGLQFRLRIPLEDGMKVRVWGVPKVYPKYGKFSITVELIEPSGEGALRRAFELLKAKLGADGLFAAERKRALPRFPERIGLVTSPEAAAYSDFLKVLRSRRGGIEIFFVPVSVQGREAPPQILQAIELLNEDHPTLDALVLVRGGGSLEDLQAFNDERIVRALARSRIPTVVGIGHERDVSLADLVADRRASTPSNAAELLTPTREEILARLSDLAGRLRQSVSDDLHDREEEVARAVSVLRESARDALEHVLSLAYRMGTVGRVFALAVEHHLSGIRRAVAVLHGSVLRVLEVFEENVGTSERVLLTLHPKRVLARGYSITSNAEGDLVRNARSVRLGEQITTTLHRGTLVSTVDSPWSPKNRSTSRRRTKNSRRSLPPSSQATLI